MVATGTSAALLHRLDRYLDAAPRTAARAEPVGPFTLFVNEGPGWQYYARPSPGSTEVTASQVQRVRARQRELRVPESFEWIADLVPGMGPAARSAGLSIVLHPIMDLPAGAFRPAPHPKGFDVRIVSPQDDLAVLQALAGVAFGAPGTDRGTVGREALETAAARVTAQALAFVRDRIERGLTITAAAFAGGTPVALGSHQPVGDVTEIVGVGTLPSFRRRGLGMAVTTVLVRDAVDRGIRTIFLSAGDQAIARVYGRVGFGTVGTAGAAEPPEG